MVQEQGLFTVTGSISEEDAEENRRVIDGIWGKPAKVNGVQLKDKHCMMMRHASGAVHYMKAGSIGKILQAAEKSLHYRDVDLYVAKNTYINKARRFDDKTTFGIRNLCIDIDSHDQSAEDVCEIINTFWADLMETHEDFHLPLPNAIVYTGRGIQSWYFLKSASKCLSFISTAVAERLCDMFEEFLSSAPITYADLDLDRASSIRCSGLYRVPGSFNPAAGCVSQGRLLSSSRWDINDLKDVIGVQFTRTHHAAPASGRAKNHASGTRSVSRHGSTCILSFLRQVAEDGRFLSREVLCHTYHAMLLSYGIDEPDAADKVYDMNKVFAAPLKEREIEALIRCDEKHHYRYREQTIFDRNCIPDDMVAKYLAKKAEERKPRDYRRENYNRDMERRKNKIRWHNEIRNLGLQGMSISEISRLTGHARNTVSKLVGTPMESLDELPKVMTRTGEDIRALKKKAVKLYKAGFRSAKKIARLLKISEEQAEKFLAEHVAEHAKIHKKTEEHASTCHFCPISLPEQCSGTMKPDFQGGNLPGIRVQRPGRDCYSFTFSVYDAASVCPLK